MRQAEIIQACYTRLNVSAVTSLLSTGYGIPAIFQAGRVPRNDAGDPAFFPYITFSLPSDVEMDTNAELGGNAIVQIDAWVRSGSAVSVGNLTRAIALATVRQAWTVPGFITCERESTDITIDPDGLTMHGMVRVRVMYRD